LDPRLQPPRFRSGGTTEAVKIPTSSKSYCAAIVTKVPLANAATTSDGKKTMTLIYSHGNATDVGAMYPLQLILSNSLECNVVSYDFSGYFGALAIQSLLLVYMVHVQTSNEVFPQTSLSPMNALDLHHFETTQGIRAKTTTKITTTTTKAIATMP